MGSGPHMYPDIFFYGVWGPLDDQQDFLFMDG